MKFRMAPNSLFAILLRSSWWISFLIVGIFVAASFALLPPDWVVFGVMGGFPFLVIGCIAFWRQMHAPSEAQVAQTADKVRAMSWPEFSRALQDAYARNGYAVEAGRGVADLVITRQGRTTLVAAKKWKAARQGEDAVQALHEARTAQDASDCILVTLGELSPNAMALARRLDVKLLQADALAVLLRPARSARA